MRNEGKEHAGRKWTMAERRRRREGPMESRRKEDREREREAAACGEGGKEGNDHTQGVTALYRLVLG